MTPAQRQPRPWEVSQGYRRYLNSVFIMLWLTIGAQGYSSGSSPHHRNKDEQGLHHRNTRLGLATSSQQLKKQSGSKKKRKKSSESKKASSSQAAAGARLARATARAKALKDTPHPLLMGTDQPSIQDQHIGSLRDLTRNIDQRLTTKNRRAASFNHGMAMTAQDSMSFLLGYNDRIKQRQSDSNRCFSVGVVFGKPLIRDLITLEYAARVRALVESLMENDNIRKDEGKLKPCLLCFCGSIAKGNHVSDADAGYLFFRHLCQSQGIDISNVDVVLDRTSTTDVQILVKLKERIRKRLNPWLKRTLGKDYREKKKQKVNIQVQLFSTEYHLCNLNDIHHRSPEQSSLHPIEVLQEECREDDDEDSGSDGSKLGSAKRKKKEGVHALVDSSWTFHYATYPFFYSKDYVEAFIGKCYLLGQELWPSYVNMKGVVNEVEFFQRDNYLVMVSIRRSLVSHVEEMYNASPSFRSGLRLFQQHDGRTVDVVLEGALLSLGRCIDIVRPAGLLVSSVSALEWAKALRALEHCIYELQTACDPDRPLDPEEWGKLGDTTSTNEEEGVDQPERELRIDGDVDEGLSDDIEILVDE